MSVASEWQPISTAPRDGTEIELTWMEDGIPQEIWPMRWNMFAGNLLVQYGKGIWAMHSRTTGALLTTWCEEDLDGAATHWRPYNSDDGPIKRTLRAANEARQIEWDAGNQISAAYRGNELAGEVGEACNVIKKLERERLGIRGSRDTVDHLAEELADVVICVDLIAMHYGIDIDAVVARKFNSTSEKVGLKTRLVT